MFDDPRNGLSGGSRGKKKKNDPPAWAVAPIVVIFTLLTLTLVVALVGLLMRTWGWAFG